MNIKEQLAIELSRRNTDYIATYIGNDESLFRELMDIVFSEEAPFPQRAAWVVTTVSDQYPGLLEPYLKKIILRLEKFEHTGIRRCLMRSLASIQVPRLLSGNLYDISSRLLISKTEPPAVKVHCMQIMYNIAEMEPDLKSELSFLLEELIEDKSPGIKSRCKELLKKM